MVEQHMELVSVQNGAVRAMPRRLQLQTNLRTCLGRGPFSVISRREAVCVAVKGDRAFALSREHAEVWYDPKDRAWFVTDLESTNGLFLNFKRLKPEKRTALTHGDRVDFGDPSIEGEPAATFVFCWVALSGCGGLGGVGGLGAKGPNLSAMSQRLDDMDDKLLRVLQVLETSRSPSCVQPAAQDPGPLAIEDGSSLTQRRARSNGYDDVNCDKALDEDEDEDEDQDQDQGEVHFDEDEEGEEGEKEASRMDTTDDMEQKEEEKEGGEEDVAGETKQQSQAQQSQAQEQQRKMLSPIVEVASSVEAVSTVSSTEAADAEVEVEVEEQKEGDDMVGGQKECTAQKEEGSQAVRIVVEQMCTKLDDSKVHFQFVDSYAMPAAKSGAEELPGELPEEEEEEEGGEEGEEEEAQPERHPEPQAVVGDKRSASRPRGYYFTPPAPTRAGALANAGGESRGEDEPLQTTEQPPKRPRKAPTRSVASLGDMTNDAGLRFLAFASSAIGLASVSDEEPSQDPATASPVLPVPER